MKRLVMAVILLLLCTLSSYARSDDVWKEFRFLVGIWKGEESGVPGKGEGDRTYEFIMDEKYLHHQNKSFFPPQENNPNGETHYDWGFYSFDKFNKKFMLREFHSEGYIITYELSTESQQGKFVFESVHVENAPPALKARYTIEKVDENTFSELFELAMPGKEFATMINNKWTRAK